MTFGDQVGCRWPHQSASRQPEVDGPWQLLRNQRSILSMAIPARAPDLVKQDAAPSLTSHKIQSLHMAHDENLLWQCSPGSGRCTSGPYQVQHRDAMAIDATVSGSKARDRQFNFLYVAEEHLNLESQLSRDLRESKESLCRAPKTRQRGCRGLGACAGGAHSTNHRQ